MIWCLTECELYETRHFHHFAEITCAAVMTTKDSCHRLPDHRSHSDRLLLRLLRFWRLSGSTRSMNYFCINLRQFDIENVQYQFDYLKYSSEIWLLFNIESSRSTSSDTEAELIWSLLNKFQIQEILFKKRFFQSPIFSCHNLAIRFIN